ncbi:MAG: hypothetical protein K0B00_14030 [Rhodobacteraceae bacterium]|nr:hypothetical protein [Paracoccaceae bacterium]
MRIAWRSQETISIAEKYKIDAGVAEAFLRANSDHAAYVAAFAPENGNSAPTVILAVRMFTGPLLPQRFIAFGLVPRVPAWEMEFIRVSLAEMAQAGGDLKKLGWQTLSGAWPPADDCALAEYNMLIGRALAQASHFDPRLAMLVRLIFVPSQAGAFPHHKPWVTPTRAQVRRDLEEIGCPSFMRPARRRVWLS